MSPTPISRVARRFLWAGLLVLAAPAAGLADTADPAPAEGPCQRGPALYRDGRFAEARTALEQCLEAEGDRVEILLPLAVMGLREGRLEAGLEFGERAVAVGPDNAEVRYWYGRALLRADRTDEAREQWETGLQLNIAHAGILEGLARLSLAEGQPAQAYNLLTQLQRQGVDDAWLHRELAELAAGKGLWRQALNHLEEAMLREEGQVEDLLMATELSLLAGDRNNALLYGRRAVRLAPGGRTWGGLGEAFFAVEEVDSAVHYLGLAVADPVAAPRYRFNLANALVVGGRSAEAGDHFRTYLAAVPEDAMGHFNYGIHLEEMGLTDEALAEIGKALVLKPDMLSALVVKAQILENAGRWDEALAAVGELRGHDPANDSQLEEWEARLVERRGIAAAARAEGKVHLLHMELAVPEVLEQVQAELAAGADFSQLAVRYSTGAAASRGGEIGWVRPEDMVEPLRGAILDLAENEISPPVESRGLYHLFKRIP